MSEVTNMTVTLNESLYIVCMCRNVTLYPVCMLNHCVLITKNKNIKKANTRTETVMAAHACNLRRTAKAGGLP